MPETTSPLAKVDVHGRLAMIVLKRHLRDPTVTANLTLAVQKHESCCWVSTESTVTHDRAESFRHRIAPIECARAELPCPFAELCSFVTGWAVATVFLVVAASESEEILARIGKDLEVPYAVLDEVCLVVDPVAIRLAADLTGTDRGYRYAVQDTAIRMLGLSYTRYLGLTTRGVSERKLINARLRSLVVRIEAILVEETKNPAVFRFALHQAFLSSCGYVAVDSGALDDRGATLGDSWTLAEN